MIVRERKTKSSNLMPRLSVLLLCIFLAIMSSIPASLAEDAVDINRLCTLSLSIDADITGMQVNLYRIAEVNEQFQFVKIDSFAFPEGLNLNTIRDFDTWKELSAILAENLGEHIPLNGTVENGIVQYKDIECGLYLVTIENFLSSGYIYSADPFIVSVPSKESVSLLRPARAQTESQIVYDVKAEIKFLKSPMLKKLLVRSRWFGESAEEKRPDEVQVHLYRNNELVRTLMLSNDNNWEEEVDGIDMVSTWEIQEEPIPENFTVNYTQELKPDMDVYVVNNYIASEEPEPSEQPVPTSTPIPLTQETPIPAEPTQKPTNTIPQTGMITCPLYLLVAAAGIFLILGVYFLTKSGAKHE